MLDFLRNVAASLVAALLILVITLWKSELIRKVLTALASAALGVDIKYVYRNGDDASSDIKDRMSESRQVRILTGRGNEFQRHLYADLLDRSRQGVVNVKILLPNTEAAQTAHGIDWVDQREEELRGIDPAFGNGTLRRQIQQNVEFLRPYIGEHLQIRQFTSAHVGRVLLMDDAVFLTPYSSTRHGRDCRVLQFGRGDLYNFFDRMFELMWSGSPSTHVAAHDDSLSLPERRIREAHLSGRD